MSYRSYFLISYVVSHIILSHTMQAAKGSDTLTDDSLLEIEQNRETIQFFNRPRFCIRQRHPVIIFYETKSEIYVIGNGRILFSVNPSTSKSDHETQYPSYTVKFIQTDIYSQKKKLAIVHSYERRILSALRWIRTKYPNF